jgi:hypothetical protein
MVLTNGGTIVSPSRAYDKCPQLGTQVTGDGFLVVSDPAPDPDVETVEFTAQDLEGPYDAVLSYESDGAGVSLGVYEGYGTKLVSDRIGPLWLPCGIRLLDVRSNRDRYEILLLNLGSVGFIPQSDPEQGVVGGWKNAGYEGDHGSRFPPPGGPGKQCVAVEEVALRLAIDGDLRGAWVVVAGLDCERFENGEFDPMLSPRDAFADHLNPLATSTLSSNVISRG